MTSPSQRQHPLSNSGQDIFSQRRAGVLLHMTSLPGPFANGDFGHAAYRFIEFLSASGITVWQCLPLGPTHSDGSPYQCLSVHAGNPLLISLDWLIDRHCLARDDVYTGVDIRTQDRSSVLHQAYQGFLTSGGPELQQAFTYFKTSESDWLDDYALYSVIRDLQQNRPWMEWPHDLRDRDRQVLESVSDKYADALDEQKFIQFIFFTQWSELRDYAHRHGVYLFGDMPIFVAHDSAEVWSQRQYFTVDEDGATVFVAGVPPDYFSETGQRWGNPLYQWEQMQADGFDWWIHRMRSQLMLFDFVRIDHFRGFEACWQIPAAAETAIEGCWIKAPGKELLSVLHDTFGTLPLVAEDLGVITPEVTALREAFRLPGMKILQFAFDGAVDNPYLPHNHIPNCVVYTGTHDNDTTLGWYQALTTDEKARVENYLGYSIDDAMPWPLIRCALASVAQLAMIPMQDILSLGADSRMNIPGTMTDNWNWRFSWEQIPAELQSRLQALLQLYGRH